MKMDAINPINDNGLYYQGYKSDLPVVHDNFLQDMIANDWRPFTIPIGMDSRLEKVEQGLTTLQKSYIKSLAHSRVICLKNVDLLPPISCALWQ